MAHPSDGPRSQPGTGLSAAVRATEYRRRHRALRSVTWSLLAFAALLSLAVAAGCAGSPQPDRPDSLLLITLDTLRADHLSCYAPDSPVKTPHLDGLAASGALVESAWATVPITAPSHASILSGLSPLAHGVRNNYRYRLPDSVTTLAERMRETGAHTAAFIAAYTATREFGLDQGFELFDDDLGADAEGRPRSQRPGAEVVDRALAWFDGHSGGRFLLWVHLFDPHSPYDPPEAYRQRYPGDPYSGEVAYTDDQVGRLLAALRESGAEGRTVIAVIADHGESLGAHGEEEHGMLLYEPTLHVPFLLAAPGKIEPGTRIPGATSGVDLLPTVLSLLDLPPVPGVQGIDLLATPPPAERLLYAESIYAHEELGWSPLYAVRQGNLKYIASPRPEFYDLAQDPGEHHNLAADRPADTARLGDALAKLQHRLLREDAIITALGSGAGESEESLARLESLGYAAGGASTAMASPIPPPAGRNPIDNLLDYQVLIRAQHLVQAGQTAAAVKMMRRLVGADPDNPQYLLKLALALEHDGQDQAADTRYREMVDRFPSFLIGHRFYAAFLQQRDRLEEARDLWRRFVDAYPDAVGAVAELARFEIETGDAARAEERLVAHLERRPADTAAWVELCRARLELGKPDEAFEAVSRAVALRPGDPHVADALVAWAGATGDRSRARQLLKDASHPRDAALQNVLERLH